MTGAPGPGGPSAPRTVWQWLVAGGVEVEALPIPLPPEVHPTARAARLTWCRDGAAVCVEVTDNPNGVSLRVRRLELAPDATETSLGAALLLCGCSRGSSVGAVLLGPPPATAFLDLAADTGTLLRGLPDAWVP